MVNQYGRSAKLTVFKIGGQLKEFTGLRVVFNIEKSDEKNPNTSKITVYNLNPDSRQFVQQEGLRLQLIVGYKGTTGNPIEGLLFQGDITKSTTEKKGPDILTTFEVGDEINALIQTTLDKTYEKGVKIKTIINDIVSSMGVVFNKKQLEKIVDSSFLSGININGKVEKTLTDLIKAQGLIFTIQDGELLFLKDGEKNENSARVFNLNTGLLGYPIKKPDGLEFTALIDPVVRPGKTVKVESDIVKISEFIKVKTVKYQGDTHFGKWFMNVEGE